MMFRLEPIGDLAILDFDVECRPMSWYAGDYCTKEITAIAWRFIHEPEESTKFWLLTPSKTWSNHQNKRRQGILRFMKAYNTADAVTGHYIRSFDLPLINATCVRLGLPPLSPKLSSDTKNDLILMGGLSKSQQNLAAMLELKHGKEVMTTHLWEEANSLVEEGRRETRRRVVGDVNQHVEFREELLKRGALQTPKMWTPGTLPEKYQP